MTGSDIWILSLAVMTTIMLVATLMAGIDANGDHPRT